MAAEIYGEAGLKMPLGSQAQERRRPARTDGVSWPDHAFTRDQANVTAVLRRRRVAAPIAPKPPTIIAHVAASGICAAKVAVPE